MRVVAFGCSNTYGHGLDDCWNPDTNGPGPHPSKYAWPQLLADKLNVQCVNMGIPGASNKLIWKSIVDFVFKKDDKVFVLWSNPDRWCIFNDKGIDLEIAHWNKSKKSQMFYKVLYNSYDLFLDTNMRMSHASHHLNIMNIVNYHNVTENIELKKYAKHVNVFSNVVPFSELKFKYDFAKDKVHAGPIAHKAYVKQILKEIL